MGTRNLLYSTH